MLRSQVIAIHVSLLTWNAIVVFSEQCTCVTKLFHGVLIIYLVVSSALDASY